MARELGKFLPWQKKHKENRATTEVEDIAPASLASEQVEPEEVKKPGIEQLADRVLDNEHFFTLVSDTMGGMREPGSYDTENLALPDEHAPIESILMFSEGQRQQLRSTIGYMDSLKQALEERVAGIERSAAGTAVEQQRMQADIEAASALMGTAWRTIGRIAELVRTVDQTADRIIMLKCQEQGVGNVQELNSKEHRLRRRLEDEQHAYGGFGRIVRSGHIKELQQELSRIEADTHIVRSARDSNGNKLWSYRDGLSRIIGRVGNRISAIVLTDGEAFIQALKEKNEQEITETSLSDVEIGELNTEYLDRYVQPEIDELFRTSSNPLTIREDTEIIRGFVRRSFDVVNKQGIATEEWSAFHKDVHQTFPRQADQGNNPMKQDLIFRHWVSSEVPANTMYQLFAQLLGHLPENRKYLRALAANKRETASFRDNISHETDTHSMRHALDVQTEVVIPRLEEVLSGLPPDIAQMLSKDLIDRWRVFRSNPAMVERFGEDRMEEAEAIFAHTISERLMYRSEHGVEAENLGIALTEFPNAEAASVVILNAFRERGHGGGYPFLQSWKNGEPPKVTDYILSLPDDVLQELEAKNIPGLMDMITTVQENKEFFSQPYAYSFLPENDPLGLNLQLRKGALRAGMHLFEHGRPSYERYFSLQLVHNLGLPLEEREIGMLLQELQSDGSRSSGDTLPRCIASQIRMGNFMMLDRLLEIAPDIEKQVTPVKELIFDGLQWLTDRGEIPEQTLGYLADYLAVGREEVVATFDFIHAVRGIATLHKEYVRDFRNCMKVARHPEALPMIERLHALGHDFNPTLSGAIMELLPRSQELLPVIDELVGLGAQESDLQGIMELFDNEDYRQLIDSFKLLVGHTKLTFDFHQVELYRRLRAVDDVEQKLAVCTPDMAGAIDDHDRLEYFISVNGELEVYERIVGTVNDPYFHESRDAKANLDKFLGRFRDGRCPRGMFVKVMTASRDPRNVKRMFMKVMALEDVTAIATENDQPIDYARIEEQGTFQELFAEVNRQLVMKALEKLYAGEAAGPAGLQENVERRIAQDERFEDDFRVMMDSVAIYARRFPSGASGTDQGTFDVLRGAIRQALELDLSHDPEAYSEARCRISRPQFERLAREIGGADVESLMKMWRDTSIEVPDTLDRTTVDTRTVLTGKLHEVRKLFDTEIMPHLRSLFKEKVAGLEKKVTEQNLDASSPFVDRLDTFKTFILDPQGEVRTDVAVMYRQLRERIRSLESVVLSDNDQASKKQAARKLGTLRYIADIIRSMHTLGRVDSERATDPVSIGEIGDSGSVLSANLHKLAIVDKEKKATKQPGSDLEGDLRGHLDQLVGIIREEDHPNLVSVSSRFVDDFNDLARAPEMTGSCQRLSEVTGHNEAAYSRILDGINQMIQVSEVRQKKTGRTTTIEQGQRLARCFTELSALRLPGEQQARLAVLLDRLYINPDFGTFHWQLSHDVLAAALKRFSSHPEVTLAFTRSEFAENREKLQELAAEYGYQFREVQDVSYYVNESNLRLSGGKYYDSFGGRQDTRKSHYIRSYGIMMLLEKNA